MKQTIYKQLEQRLRKAFDSLGFASDVPLGLVVASKPEFGDYQVNGVMTLAKSIKTNPRALAENIIRAIDLSDMASEVSLAGPGFINIRLADDFLAKYLDSLSTANKFGVRFLEHKNQTVVVDLSSPNLAKEMHVGHLRSTVIGDALARIFDYLGDSVVRQNHVGDWGTQFGMLIAYMRDLDTQDVTADTNVVKSGYSFLVKDLEEFYRKAKLKFDEDQEFANKARQCVVELQHWNVANASSALTEPLNSDLAKPTLPIEKLRVRNEKEHIINLWSVFRDESLRHCQSVYDALGLGKELSTNPNDGVICGESKYEADLAKVVDDLLKIKTANGKELVTQDDSTDGAACIFFEPGDLPGGETTPFIIEKKDGAYLYSTTDLAALRYRVNHFKADKIVYVVDARQSFHFKQLFKVAEKSHFDRQNGQADSKPVTLIHSAFGTMMNEDGRPFKTRDGGTVKLMDLIIDAKARAFEVVKTRNPEWSEPKQRELADIMAIAAIKYSDLAKNRLSDYIFSFDKMLSFEGNTAPYLLYANTRICSLIAKASDVSVDEVNLSPMIINETTEHRLAIHIANFANLLESAATECYPHSLCQYLYNLSGLFMQFYESCPILKSESKIKLSRLKLAKLTQNILQTGLNLLGIQTVSEM